MSDKILRRDIPFVSLFEKVASKNCIDVLKFKQDALDNYIKNIDFNKFNNLKDFIFKNQFYIPDLVDISSVKRNLTCFFDMDFYTIVLYNGIYIDELSDVVSVSVKNCNFTEDLSSLSFMKAFFNEEIDDPFVCLNTAFLSNCVFIEVDDGIDICKPINIINIIGVDNCKNVKAFIPSRLFINLKNNSKIDIIKTDLSYNNQKSFGNSIVNIKVGKNSLLNYYTLNKNSEYFFEQEFINVLDFGILNNVNYVSNLGNLFQSKKINIQNNVSVDSVLSLLGKNNSGSGIDILLSHEGNNSRSNVKLYGVADDVSSIYFKTNVKCFPLTIGTDTSQQSKIILKSNLSYGRIEPYQTISTEQAQAFHGAVISGILDEELFFLESRGINRTLAKDLICNCCLAGILQHVNDDKIYDSYLKNMKL